ncbi:MAG: peptidoglycan DD-metalloendopeptidase family protein [Pseudohongiellaceae bacterium]
MNARLPSDKPVNSRVLLTCLLALALVACRSNPPAPVTEAGRPLDRTPPIIVQSNGSSADVDVSRARPRREVQTGAVTPTNPANPAVHIVRRGETLFSIAYQYDLDFRQLAIANELNPPYTIFVDQELNLDVSRVIGSNRSIGTDLGTPVSDSSVARTSAGSSRSGVIRQPIETVQRDPLWQWPLAGEVLRRYSAGGNEGLDIGARSGTPVRAASAGDVVYAGRGIQGAGNLIIIRHTDRFLSAYSHNRNMLVSEGERVAAGQQIAEVGENAAGVPVLHFEIRREGKAVDPGEFLPNR